ncbi:uncharacterized protein LOC117169427 isoform X2 [Belonocnema kinseyi]|uniref:uncharacterized protein LOC117169427 isoform X2 n=1 Tax=Belonocnema kinseyi TaxID=2817044 RepID=UPI00143CC510|nr:uncharacterized protein LOC117169427 isoform X2 [Belonocnema kinseyi]
MYSKVNKYRSLPPFVEGKIHGYINLIVDEVIWATNNPGDVTVIASWWGEKTGAQFRPLENTEVLKKLEDTEKTYTIKTNFQLFEDYIKNCGSLELTIKAEKKNKVIGTAHVIDLLDIFKSKPFTRYFPIVDESEKSIGSIHVSIEVTDATSIEKMTVKAQTNQKSEVDEELFVDKKSFNTHAGNLMNSKVDFLFPARNTKQEEHMYRSILKDKRIEFVEPIKKFNFEVPERLQDQANIKARKLKSALLKEALEDESFVYDAEKFLYENFHPDVCPEKEAKLYEYFLGKEMNFVDECTALETLRSTSPTRSLIEFATESMHCRQPDNPSVSEINKTNFLKDDVKGEVDEIKVYNENPVTEFKTRVISPLDYVDSLQVIVRSLYLTPAGYRRVKSSCLSQDVASNSVTYFVHYDSINESSNQLKKKCIMEKKPVKMSSRKEIDQEIHFNHQGVYNISKSYTYMDNPVKFRVFHRHLNQRSPTLLGIGSLYVNDVVATKHLTMSQRVAVVNKGIKVGELEVTVELGCDGIHFGKDFVDAVMSAKENIPVLESLSSLNTRAEKFKTATGTQSNSNSGASSVSSRRVDCISAGSNAGTNDRRALTGRIKYSGEDRNAEILTSYNKTEGKVLLHGLIYIAEGRDLPESNTYLICRAFWREDRAASRICTRTKNPLYNFHQLVPLIHGPDLLERTKDNFIVTEVYSRNPTGEEDLLGIAKFPVHQLYVAYRDPHVLPHLLLSKYPVISVDGWVPIKDPVSGQLQGQLQGLVALGTADQIALLEMTRGIRDTVVTPRAPLISAKNAQQTLQSIPDHPLQSASSANQRSAEAEVQATQNVSLRNEECQTEMCTLEAFKDSDPTITETSDVLKNQSKVLHTIVDCLAQALHVSRTNINQASQTDRTSCEEVQTRSNEIEPLCLDPLSNSLSDNSSNGSPRNNFTIPTGMYRSVGVGAEFDDASNQGSSNDYNGFVNVSSGTLNPLIDEQMETDRLHYEDLSFRAVVEIECALHLPKVEKINAAVDPSTYVTFQGAPNGSVGQPNSYIITNICSRTCNPKWDWRCDTKLPADLLTNDEKRLILKVWRLYEPDICTELDMDRDIVIGFAAIDLSVLTAGFPLVSGWFHIIDFTGKCNGQIKVSITPLGSTSAFGKSIFFTSINKIPSEPCQSHQSNQSNQSSPLPKTMRFNNTDLNNLANNAASSANQNLEDFNYQSVDEPMPDTGLGLGDASLSILSQSLKQKLTELNEITERLQSRLHDVTENAFEDEFDNFFELNEQPTENECSGVQRANSKSPESVDTAINKRQNCPPLTNNKRSSEINSTFHRDEKPSSSKDFNNHCSTSSATNTITMDTTFSDTGYSTSYNARSAQHFLNDRSNTDSVHSSDREEDNPIKGTKMHVNHLLDKLSSQLNTPPAALGMLPTKINIMEFLSNLQPSNNNNNRNYFQSDRNREQINRTSQDEINRRSQEILNRRGQDQSSLVTESNIEEMRHSQDENSTCSIPNSAQSLADHFRSESAVSSTTHNRNKISNVIREEMAAEEENDSAEFDELSTHLMAANFRHADVDNVFNPLLYQHLLPDVQLSPNSYSCSVSQDVQNRNATPEGEAVQQLDNRYTENFNAAINSGLSRLRNLIENNALANSDNNRPNQRSLFENDSSGVFRSTPVGVSEDVDGNIDVTVIHRPSIDDLMASNSSKSVTSLSMDKLTERQPETDEENTLMSSESSASTISRQAPDGGNPVEEADKRASRKRDSRISGSES